jgi:hypothetical protein
VRLETAQIAPLDSPKGEVGQGWTDGSGGLERGFAALIVFQKGWGGLRRLGMNPRPASRALIQGERQPQDLRIAAQRPSVQNRAKQYTESLLKPL